MTGVMSTEDDEEVDSEIQMFQNADFSSVKARDVMSPRTEIVALDLFDIVEELKDLFIDTGYSMVAYGNLLDDILEYVHSLIYSKT
jgi:CBS domain containing-hemolysin-like protein